MSSRLITALALGVLILLASILWMQSFVISSEPAPLTSTVDIAIKDLASNDLVKSVSSLPDHAANSENAPTNTRAEMGYFREFYNSNQLINVYHSADLGSKINIIENLWRIAADTKENSNIITFLYIQWYSPAKEIEVIARRALTDLRKTDQVTLDLISTRNHESASPKLVSELEQLKQKAIYAQNEHDRQDAFTRLFEKNTGSALELASVVLLSDKNPDFRLWLLELVKASLGQVPDHVIAYVVFPLTSDSDNIVKNEAIKIAAMTEHGNWKMSTN